MNGMRRHASALIQGALVLALIALLVLLVSNLLANMKMRGIQTGLDFLLEPVGFDISESWLTHTAEDPFWHAFLVGLINTLRVAVPGIVLATFIGLVVAVARISPHPLARALARTYIEVLRNVPLLIQLLMGYIALIELMPAPDAAWLIGPFEWSKAGLSWGAEGTGLSPEYLDRKSTRLNSSHT